MADTTDAKVEQAQVIRVTWRDGAYYVNRPNWNGGDVVALSDYAALHAEAAQLQAALAEARRDAELGREIAEHFLPVMEAMRPLVLNLERLKDALHQHKENSQK